ncbi:GNAT family N-acetyltransferase [Aquimarina mytili]|uniref:GNAT family N-acetyltransferase n=1 Tax=Aquimarina mytili TaxID=874423 RepID=A0A936ZWG2_9FLAO|nr:GNAT family N-acetyltransferase [Aquimarina mytili]MBL0685552.1 GNAT family N-acetyltransferase [Aquimarina mytili]
MDITLRIATINDLDLLEYWDKQQHVIDSDPDEDWDWENELLKFPEWREQLIAELDGRPIGCIQIIDPAEEESHYWGNIPRNLRAIDIWIGEKEDLGKGYGSKMMEMAVDRCFKNPEVVSILIDPLESNHDAIRFYENFGFTFIEKRSFNSSDCLVYQLSRKDWKEKISKNE